MNHFTPSERKEKMKDGGDKGGALYESRNAQAGWWGWRWGTVIGNTLLSGYQTSVDSSCAETIFKDCRETIQTVKDNTKP